MPPRPDRARAAERKKELETFTVKAALGKALRNTAPDGFARAVETRVKRLHQLRLEGWHLLNIYARLQAAASQALLPPDYVPALQQQSFYRQFFAAVSTCSTRGGKSPPQWLLPALQHYRHASPRAGLTWLLQHDLY